MIPLAIVNCFCEPEAAPILAAFYPSRGLMEVVLLKAEELQTGVMAAMGISQIRLSGLSLPCIDSCHETVLAEAELVIERDQVWWTGYELHHHEGRDRWETQAVPLHVLELDARQQGSVRSRAVTQLIEADFGNDSWSQGIVDSILAGHIPFPSEDGQPLRVDELVSRDSPKCLEGLVQRPA